MVIQHICDKLKKLQDNFESKITFSMVFNDDDDDLVLCLKTSNDNLKSTCVTKRKINILELEKMLIGETIQVIDDMVQEFSRFVTNHRKYENEIKKKLRSKEFRLKSKGENMMNIRVHTSGDLKLYTDDEELIGTFRVSNKAFGMCELIEIHTNEKVIIDYDDIYHLFPTEPKNVGNSKLYKASENLLAKIKGLTYGKD